MKKIASTIALLCLLLCMTACTNSGSTTTEPVSSNPASTPAFDRICMHEFVLDLSEFKKETGVSALDVAKSLIDYGMHPPTMYFPLIVHEALMLEPTETESRETLDWAAEVYRKLYDLAHTDPDWMHGAPHNAQIGRPDEVRAARNPVLRYEKP